jgi:glycosyltransferase involved in cell wall biosynthesis
MRKKVIFDPQGAMALLGKRERKSLYNTIARRIIGNTLDYIASHISDVILFVSNDDMAFFVKNYKIEETKAKLVRLVVEVSEPCKKMLKRKNQLVFIGNLNSIQNKTAAEFIIKDLAPNLKEYNFFIIGKGKIHFEHNLNNIHLTGFIEDPKELICSSSLAVVPLISGTGVKTKILYFLSLGIPVITTQIGAEGLINTKSILNKGLFISDIHNFRENIKKACEISVQVNPNDLRNYVIENHSTDSMRKDIENIFHEIIN